MTVTQEPWWKNAVVYQVWPASFKDSNGDGIGDLNGLTSKLDHIKSLGTDVIWLSPHYASPMDDMGYDISDYNAINPQFGTMEDMDNLLAEVKKRDMKLILDLVINHTSSEHQWFKESRSSRDNPKRDWYIWKDKANNWMSMFSGSAWKLDEQTGQYYLHLFAESQPDLNWENPETREAIYKSALEFWYEKGVSGFRIDVCSLYSKVQTYADAAITIPGAPYQPSWEMCVNGPRIHEFHKEMYEKVTSKYDAMTVGEVGNCSKADALKYSSAKEKEINMMFLFDAVSVGAEPTDRFIKKAWQLTDFKDAIKSQSEFIYDDETGELNDAWSTVFIENHDQPRSNSRFGNVTNKLFWERSSKLISMLQVTLTGTLFLYQGQEIGMTNVPLEWDPKEYLDIQTVNYWKAFLKDNPSEEEKQKRMEGINLLARDHARTPVQWDDSTNAGFGDGKPWMRVNDNYKEINVAKQVNDENSVLSFWKNAIKLRKAYSDTLVFGKFEIFDYENQQVFAYSKTKGNKKVSVFLNFSDKEVDYTFPEGELILTNVTDGLQGKLQPYEGRVISVKN
ncbi:CYFA0S03e05952g1_1 [Cyberlindnera fabianii]|uniref:CYFA0S03e05952g1_1 n=1 Tax=Cyberlindnera fabianii TaxID=36022 RepID=A0A061AR82_CYBFA|nr:CYFA0S03e05952g1_1 [Cyberlindnera fabianii]